MSRFLTTNRNIELLEPYEGKLSRTVLRGERGSNAPALPDIDDELGHNAESILIAASIKLLRRLDPNLVAVQSFADGRLGCGTIYKAANFQYYGFHLTKFLRNRRSGEMVHEQIFTNSTSPSGFLRANVGMLIGDFEVFHVKTYRYIYALDKRFRCVKPQQPYPAYDKGMEATEWKRDRSKMIERCVGILTKMAADSV